MPTSNDSSPLQNFVASDELRVGLYIFLDIPWFRHSFTLNSFKISSAEQICELQALGKARFRFDADRSTAPVADPVEAPR